MAFPEVVPREWWLEARLRRLAWEPGWATKMSDPLAIMKTCFAPGTLSGHPSRAPIPGTHPGRTSR